VGRAFVVPEETEKAAAETLATLRGRFEGSVDAAGPGEEAFTARDAYLGRLVVFRKRSRVAGVANTPEGADAMPLAHALAQALP